MLELDANCKQPRNLQFQQIPTVPIGEAEMSSVITPGPHASPDYSIADANPPRPGIATRVPVHPPSAPSVPVDRRTEFAATESTEQQPVFPENSDSLGKKYKYSPLPPRNIRLLHLMPYDGDGDPIHCQLFEYPIQETWERADLYEALSYCWGGSGKPCSISIGECYLPITANLHAALLRLRHRLIGRVIWIDAVCINQEDKEEQAQQVRSMAEIYFKASRVIVWLGEAEAEDHDTLKAICAPCDESKSSSGILALFARPWFRRIWVWRAMPSTYSTGVANQPAAGASGSGRSSSRPDHVWIHGS